jgi:hypothetical protein
MVNPVVNPVATAIGFAFPTGAWWDPFDTDEPATQWFFGNQNRISRAWIAPTEADQGWGFTEEEDEQTWKWRVFTNPRSCLYCLEKSAIVAGGQVLREWPGSTLIQRRAPESCGQHNGLYVVYSQAQASFPVDEATKYAGYDDALAQALTESRDPRQAGARVMVARVVDAESLW